MTEIATLYQEFVCASNMFVWWTSTCGSKKRDGEPNETLVLKTVATIKHSWLIHVNTNSDASKHHDPSCFWWTPLQQACLKPKTYPRWQARTGQLLPLRPSLLHPHVPGLKECQDDGPEMNWLDGIRSKKTTCLKALKLFCNVFQFHLYPSVFGTKAWGLCPRGAACREACSHRQGQRCSLSADAWCSTAAVSGVSWWPADGLANAPKAIIVALEEFQNTIDYARQLLELSILNQPRKDSLKKRLKERFFFYFWKILADPMPHRWASSWAPWAVRAASEYSRRSSDSCNNEANRSLGDEWFRKRVEGVLMRFCLVGFSFLWVGFGWMVCFGLGSWAFFGLLKWLSCLLRGFLEYSLGLAVCLQYIF